MALVTTMSGVIGVLAAMALLLWFSAYIESRHLGPVQQPSDVAPVEPAMATAPHTGTDPLSPAA